MYNDTAEDFLHKKFLGGHKVLKYFMHECSVESFSPHNSLERRMMNICKAKHDWHGQKYAQGNHGN